MSAKDYAYDVDATGTVVWTFVEAFGNTKRTAPGDMPWSVCPITSCEVKQSDCSTALVAPFNTLISTDVSTHSLKVSQTQGSGYPDVTVCYACTNYGHRVTNQIVVRQHINCAIATNSNSTSLLKDYKTQTATGSYYAAKPYAASPTHADLSEYAASISIFTYQNSVDCGGMTACEVLPVGCTGSYAGNAAVVANTGALSIRQDIDAGYTETLCVKCSNALGSSI